MLHLLLLIGPDWLWHPLGQCTAASANHTVAMHEITRCKSYNFHSGIGANGAYIVLFFSALVTAWGFYKHRQCNVELPRNCRKWGHKVPGTAEYACNEHHPHGDPKGSGRTAASIRRHHEESGV